MTRSATQAERFDHDRDNRKHEPRPGDKDFPARFDKPLTTAMDIVVLVKALPNYTEAAALIEQYARMIAASAVADETLRQLQRVGGAHA